MKKTLIIVAVIAVVAVVAFLLLRKKDEPTDGKNVGVVNPNAEEKSEEENQNEIDAQQLESTRKDIAANNYDGFATKEDLQDAGLILTAQEEKERIELANRYFAATGISAKNMDLSALRIITPEVESAKVIYEKLKNEFPAASYDIDYNKTVVLGKSDYDEQQELQDLYDKYTKEDEYIKTLAANFMVDLQDGIVWSDDARPVKKTVGAILSGGLSLINRNTDKDANALFKDYRAWNTTNTQNILNLTTKQAKRFENYMKQAYTDFLFRVEKEGAKVKSKCNRKNAYSYNDKSKLSRSNFSMAKLLTYNGADSGPHATGYFRRRDEKSGKNYSIELYDKFKNLK